MFRALICCFVLLLWPCGSASYGQTVDAADSHFFYSGDGWIHLVSEKNGATFQGHYRAIGGRYKTTALKQISRVFGAPYGPRGSRVALRLIAFLDYLEDRHRKGARIVITSGYRNPQYNTNLRQKGRLAAKASLHQYGMAADFKMQGIPSKKIWEDVKALGFGGTGYYQGETVHVDVGPARSWDQTSSGVGTGISDDNKLIGLVTDYDIYRPGQPIVLRFIRMTAFPIGVMSMFELAPVGRIQASPVTFRPSFAIDGASNCPSFESIDQMAAIRWQLPQNLPPGRYRIRASFCESVYPDMPNLVLTPEFELSTDRP